MLPLAVTNPFRRSVAEWLGPWFCALVHLLVVALHRPQLYGALVRASLVGMFRVRRYHSAVALLVCLLATGCATNYALTATSAPEGAMISQQGGASVGYGAGCCTVRCRPRVHSKRLSPCDRIDRDLGKRSTVAVRVGSDSLRRRIRLHFPFQPTDRCSRPRGRSQDRGDEACSSTAD